MKIFNLILIFILTGCQTMPKEPKKPDSSPRVPINKTVPVEAQPQIRGLS